MKVCTKCFIEKHEVDFYTASVQNGKRRLRGDCKLCVKASNKEYHKSEKWKCINKKAKKKWYETKGREYHKRWDLENRDRRKSYVAKWLAKEENIIKKRAHWRIHELVRSGRMKKGRCEKCGSEKAHAHHFDYSQPENVLWLCAVHHKAAHSGEHL